MAEHPILCPLDGTACEDGPISPEHRTRYEDRFEVFLVNEWRPFRDNHFAHLSADVAVIKSQMGAVKWSGITIAGAVITASVTVIIKHLGG